VPLYPKFDRESLLKDILLIEECASRLTAEWTGQRSTIERRENGKYTSSLYSGMIREDVDFFASNEGNFPIDTRVSYLAIGV
jgi:hypothetical protein